MGYRRSKQRRGGSWKLALAFLIAAGAAAAYWHHSGRPIPSWLPSDLRSAIEGPAPDVSAGPSPPSPPIAPDDAAEISSKPSEPAPLAADAPMREPIPTLDDSDARWRELVAPYARHPLARSVLDEGNLIRTFAAATLEIAEGRNPRKRFPELELEGAFQAQGDLLYLRVDPVSYRRYDALVDAFVALDTEGLLRSYAQLEPLFDEAYAELGYPGEDFDAVLRAAIDRLLTVPVIGKPLALVPRAKTYAYEDPKLESLPHAQRQLLRMGPKNVERVQKKLREVKAKLENRVDAR